MPSHLDRVKACRDAVLAGELVAAESFVALPLDEVARAVNGCGTTVAKFDFVPDRILGLTISPACFIHDWDYSEGVSLEHKHASDGRFLLNLLSLIERERGVVASLLRPFRRRSALLYCEAVTDFGAPAYWAGKPR